jgi:cation transport ATPase
MGVRVGVITGDAREVADAVAAELGIDEVFAEVLPGDKADAVASLQHQGLRVAMVHALRHSAASLMAQAGVPVTSISAQLGHANAAITQSIYSHVLPGMQSEAAERMAAALRG